VTSPPDAAIPGLETLPAEPHVLTIGNFDGVHRGHQFLISRVIDDARVRRARSLVLTFEPHPTSVLRPDVPFERLTTPEEKQRLLASTGVDDLVVIPFTAEFARLSAEEFLSGILPAGPVAVHVGEGFRFGHGRLGDGNTIRQFGERAGFETHVIPRLRNGEHVISSSAIRTALKQGDIASANTWLGRRYVLRGTVERGAARGRDLGFPTANLHLPANACLPSDGIYAAYARLPNGDQHPYHAMVYVGTRPTFDGGSRIVEANLLDFQGDLYTRELVVEFVAFVRGDARFDSPAALASQMAQDERDTREIFDAQSAEARA
jgi:riboflavin kinase/FMN adenylyltransferase